MPNKKDKLTSVDKTAIGSEVVLATENGKPHTRRGLKAGTSKTTLRRPIAKARNLTSLKLPISPLHAINPVLQKTESLIDLLDAWDIASPKEVQEQRETWEFLQKALDEDRLSERKLFP